VRKWRGTVRRAQPETAEHQHRLLAECAARRQHAELHRRLVDVKEAPHAVEPVVPQLAVEDAVHDDESAGGRQAVERLTMRPQQLARGGEEASVGEPRAGAFQARVGKARPQSCRVGRELVQARQRLVGERILVLDARRADLVKGGGDMTGPRRLPAVDQRVGGQRTVPLPAPSWA